MPGSRHPKRWQDIDELLAAGIDVFSTLNVQHIESLNDVVGGITGINVWETVPDFFFDQADEVVMVDVSADDLLARLAAGKVYLPEQIERAASNFFRKGNLMALRELALRRTADRVEDDVQAYRSDKAIERVWKTEDSLLCCIGPGPGGDDVVRSAARLAAQLGVDWTAAYVETPALQRLPAPERERILQDRQAGAGVRREHGDPRRRRSRGGSGRVRALAQLLEGASSAARVVASRWPWARGMAQRVGELAPDIDLIEVGRGAAQPAPPREPRRREPRSIRGAASSGCATCGRCSRAWRPPLVATPLLPYFDLANIVMLFLLTVVLVAVKWGRGPAVLAAFVSVATFDFFFVPPRFSFAVSDFQYLLTFAVMLAVALIIGQMTAGPALPGARRVVPRGARPRAVRVRARHVEPAADRRRRRGGDEDSSRTRSAPRSRSCCPTTRIVCSSPPAAGRDSRSTSARRSGRTTSRSPRAPAPTRSPATSTCTCRCGRRCARAACW